jgi:hypothetical protein
MNTNPDRLDDAIDAVAARMTNVTEENGLAMRIADALPERSQWLPFAWISRIAIGALATGAIILVLPTFDDGSTTVLRTDDAVAVPIVEQPADDLRTLVEPRQIVRRTSESRPLNLRRTTDDVERPDHERSLAPIESAAALDIAALTPAMLPEDAPLTVESLQIADLPLTAEFSPR